ncbi:MAG TPA: hypothetical protein ENN07_04705 [candidate division Zixibacteria bacterium]|nr:hypothetical protein [candidate division Zixibacteria bacterium]
MARAIVLCVILAISAFSAQFWVHSQNGDDGFGGTSPDSAFATIGAATNAMGEGDTAFICGVFQETVTLENGQHEGTSFLAWPDSAYWTVDGEETRRCIVFNSGVGTNGEPMATVRNLKAIAGSDYNIYVNTGNYISFASCTIAINAFTGMFITNSVVFVDSSHFDANTPLNIRGSAFRIRNSRLLGDFLCVNLNTSHTTFTSIGNFYSAERGVYFNTSSSSVFIEDEFRCSVYSASTSTSGNGLHHFKRCLFVGGDIGIFGYRCQKLSLINCTMDSVKRAIDWHAGQANVTLYNTIIANADTALRSIDFLTSEGLVIFNAIVDTSNITTPIEYHTFDPELDSLKIAQASTARQIGTNADAPFTPPLWDDRGFWFRDEHGRPAVGWRSPYETTGWPTGGATADARKWHMSTPGRRLR